jgi:putative transposase
VEYRRNLPHFQPDGKTLFITWRLHGTLPFFKSQQCETSGKAFAEADRQLERCERGPVWLSDSRIARCVTDTILKGRPAMYGLIAFVVIPNHVHIVIEPKIAVPRITKWIKGASAHAANLILNRTGHFWQDESFDRWVRSEDELRKTFRYVEWNPVRALLASEPDQWQYSSAFYAERRTG